MLPEPFPKWLPSISFLESLKNEDTSNYIMKKSLIIFKAMIEGRINMTSAYNEIGGGHN
jgi:hypothetical protein